MDWKALVIAWLAIVCMIGCTVTQAQELDVAYKNGPVFSFPFNDSGIKFRIGYAGNRTEMGPVVGYRDDISPDRLEAYVVGVYALWYANPSGQIPIGDLFPDSWAGGLPASIPVIVYVGLEVDYEIEDHNILGGPLGGLRIKTLERVELGLEYVYEGLIAQWFPGSGTTVTSEKWKLWLVPWFNGRKGIPAEELGDTVAKLFGL